MTTHARNRSTTPKARMAATTLACTVALLTAGCSFSTSTSTEELSGGDAVATGGTVEQLCATAVQWQQPLADAGNAGLGPLAEAKLGYLQAARAVAPPTWADNIDVIIPAWETLQAVIQEAEGDASRIDFDKFFADFADATANDQALEAFVQSRCV